MASSVSNTLPGSTSPSAQNDDSALLNQGSSSQHGFVASKPVSSSFRVTVPPSPNHGEVDVATNVDDTDHGGEAKSSKARVWYIVLGGVVVLLVLFIIVAAVTVKLRESQRSGTCTGTSEGRTGPPSFQTFPSCSAMARALKDGSCGWYHTSSFSTQFGEQLEAVALSADSGGASKTSTAAAPSSANTQSTANDGADFSGTNVQVAGVDESDIAKTDGTFIYTISKSSGALFIVRAHPASASQVRIESKILLNREHNVYPIDMFLDKDRLMVFGSSQHTRTIQRNRRLVAIVNDDDATSTLPTTYRFSAVTTLLFDISDRTAPRLLRRVDVQGQYVTARKIESDVFMVTGSWPHYYAYAQDSSEAIAEDLVPLVSDSDGSSGLSSAPSRFAEQTDHKFVPVSTCAEVGYVDIVRANSFVTVVSMSMAPGGESIPLHTTTTAGRGYNVYASHNGLYLASGNFNWRGETTAVLAFDLVRSGSGPGVIPSPSTSFRGIMQVPGTILDQYSMDEHAGAFRIATTKRWPVSTNNVFTYNLTAPVNASTGFIQDAGSLQGLAPGERIYSTRFMGDRLVMVTFRTIDPLFVIDLSDPRAPRVLGELKLPGYSEYLHPVNSTHIIGVGKDAAVETVRSWTRAIPLGVKLGMFDITNVTAPRELFNAQLGVRGTSSPVLNDAKAFLFDASRQLMVLPARLYLFAPSGAAPTADAAQAGSQYTESTYGSFVFQGAFVYHVSNSAFELRGAISHSDAVSWPLTSSSTTCYDTWSNCPWDQQIERSLYINQTLYTISNAKVAANSLDTLASAFSITLNA